MGIFSTFSKSALLAAAVFSQASIASQNSEMDNASFAPQFNDHMVRDDVLIYTTRLIMPYGASSFTDILARPTSSKVLKLRLSVEPSCPRAPFVNFLVRNAETRNWHPTTVTNGNNTHNLRSIDGIRFDINQPWAATLTCQFYIYATTETGPTIPDDTEWGAGHLAGTIRYQGGFDSSLSLAVDASRKIKGFRLAVPTFCKDVDVLEAGTVSSGFYDAATLADESKRFFKVAGRSVRATEIQATMNGPLTATCDIPIYVYFE
ncbi:MAG: hypothetical protein NT027_18290 [Proteobacteria bacterium]|nr:hypothetical protein [Pseudomonadota bacterium]